MPDFHDRITDFCVGDDLDLRFKVTKIPSGQTVAEAWCTVKEDPDDADENAVFQKHITTVNDEGIGQIEDAGAAGTATLRFDWRKAETILFVPNEVYYHDIQIKLSGGLVSTPFKGLTFPKGQITISD